MAKPKAKANELIITLIRHFDKDDVEFKGDYYDSEIMINGELFMTLGAYNSDFDPVDYFEGFTEGIKFLDSRLKNKLVQFQVEKIRKADYSFK